MARLLARFSTLRWRLTLFYCALLALLLAAVGVSVYARFDDALKSNVSNRLHDLAMVIAPPLNITSKLANGNQLESLKANEVLLEYIKTQLLQNESATAIYIGVVDIKGATILDNQPFKQPLGVEAIKPQLQAIPSDGKGAVPREYETALDIAIEPFAGGGTKVTQSRGIAYVVPISEASISDANQSKEPDRNPTPAMYLVLVAPLDEVDAALQQIAYILVTGLLAALIIALLLGLPIARLGLKPLRRMAGTAANISAGDMSKRVALPSRKPASTATMQSEDEVQQLAQAFNAMLDRLEASFQAQAKSEARTKQFAADASHEMRSPLTVLGGYIDVLLMGAKEDPVQTERILNAMQRENHRLGRLVVDLLLLTRMDANGTSWLRLEEVALKDLAARAVDNMRMVADQRSLQLTVSEDAENITLRGDGDQLYRMLTNLLDNAIRYTPPNGQISLTLRRSYSEPREITLQVADNGCGIAPDKLPHIFDRFYRADESRARQTGNAGLGLAIADSIAKAHGGHITVESELAKGTTFTVHLSAISVSQRTLSPVSANSKPALLN